MRDNRALLISLFLSFSFRLPEWFLDTSYFQLFAHFYKVCNILNVVQLVWPRALLAFDLDRVERSPILCQLLNTWTSASVFL